MENKINIAEILKDCPKGIELDCALFENLEFDHINKDNGAYPIICRVKTEWGSYNVHTFTEYGCYDTEKYSKCVIFPKGKTTWKGFVPPCKFKDGDIISVENACGCHTFIYNNITNEYGGYGYYVIITSMDNFKINNFCSGSKYRLATEEEKQKLFDAIKANGYKWNTESKTLEKLPKFKAGDKIKKNGDTRLITIEDVRDNYYIITIPDYFDNCYITDKLSFSNQNNYELVPNKFDITTLKPFESRVLIRDGKTDIWSPAIWGCLRKDGIKAFLYIVVGGLRFNQCIPYVGNEHLLGTNNDCEEFYKTWK